MQFRVYILQSMTKRTWSTEIIKQILGPIAGEVGNIAGKELNWGELLEKRPEMLGLEPEKVFPTSPPTLSYRLSLDDLDNNAASALLSQWRDQRFIAHWDQAEAPSLRWFYDYTPLERTLPPLFAYVRGHHSSGQYRLRVFPPRNCPLQIVGLGDVTGLPGSPNSPLSDEDDPMIIFSLEPGEAFLFWCLDANRNLLAKGLFLRGENSALDAVGMTVKVLAS